MNRFFKWLTDSPEARMYDAIYELEKKKIEEKEVYELCLRYIYD